MPPAVAAAGIAAGGAIGGSILSNNAKKKATNKALASQERVAESNNALARENRDILTGYIKPYNEMGLAASGQLSDAIAKGPYGSTLTSSVIGSDINPGGFDQYLNTINFDGAVARGERGLGFNYAAKGAGNSGAALKALADYRGTQKAGAYRDWQGFRGNYLNYADQFNRNERAFGADQYANWTGLLGNQQNVGMAGVQALAGVGNNYTNNVTSNNNQLAAAQGNAALAKGFSNANMYAGIGNALGSAAGLYSMGGLGGGGTQPNAGLGYIY